LNAKCHAIRDAQILEKGQIRREMDHEEQRLDVMMEVDRQNAITIQEEIEKKRKEERLIGKYWKSLRNNIIKLNIIIKHQSQSCHEIY